MALADKLGVSLPYSTHEEVRQRLHEIAPHLALMGDRVAPSRFVRVFTYNGTLVDIHVVLCM